MRLRTSPRTSPRSCCPEDLDPPMLRDHLRLRIGVQALGVGCLSLPTQAHQPVDWGAGLVGGLAAILLAPLIFSAASPTATSLGGPGAEAYAAVYEPLLRAGDAD